MIKTGAFGLFFYSVFTFGLGATYWEAAKYGALPRCYSINIKTIWYRCQQKQDEDFSVECKCEDAPLTQVMNQ